MIKKYTGTSVTRTTSNGNAIHRDSRSCDPSHSRIIHNITVFDSMEGQAAPQQFVAGTNNNSNTNNENGDTSSTCIGNDDNNFGHQYKYEYEV